MQLAKLSVNQLAHLTYDRWRSVCNEQEPSTGTSRAFHLRRRAVRVSSLSSDCFPLQRYRRNVATQGQQNSGKWSRTMWGHQHHHHNQRSVIAAVYARRVKHYMDELRYLYIYENCQITKKCMLIVPGKIIAAAPQRGRTTAVCWMDFSSGPTKWLK